MTDQKNPSTQYKGDQNPKGSNANPDGGSDSKPESTPDSETESKPGGHTVDFEPKKYKRGGDNELTWEDVPANHDELPEAAQEDALLALLASQF